MSRWQSSRQKQGLRLTEDLERRVLVDRGVELRLAVATVTTQVCVVTTRVCVAVGTLKTFRAGSIARRRRVRAVQAVPACEAVRVAVPVQWAVGRPVNIT